MTHVVVHIAPGHFEVGLKIPNSEYLIPTHQIRHKPLFSGSIDIWEVWDQVTGDLIGEYDTATEAIESACNGKEWALYGDKTRH